MKEESKSRSDSGSDMRRRALAYELQKLLRHHFIHEGMGIEGSRREAQQRVAAILAPRSEQREWMPVNEAPRNADYLSDGMLTVYAWRHDENGDNEQLFKFVCPNLPPRPDER